VSQKTATSLLADLTIFSVQNTERIWHQQLVDFLTLHVICSHFTLGKSHFWTILFIRTCTSDYLHYLRIKRTVTVTANLPITPERCHCTTLWNAELIRVMEGIWFPSKRWWLWKGELCCVALVAVKRVNCVVWQVECQPSNVTARLCKVTTVCMNAHFCLLCHWLIAWSTKLCWNSAHVSISRFRNSCISRIGTWCTRFCTMLQMQ